MAIVLQRPLFIGRDEQISQYRAFLRQTSSRLLQITGIPGCGKSAFLQYIQRQSEAEEIVVLLDFADETLRVDPLRLLSDLSWSIAPFCDKDRVEAFRQQVQEERTYLTYYYNQQLEELTERLQEQLLEKESAVDHLVSTSTIQDLERVSIQAAQDALLSQLETLSSQKHLILLFDTCEWLNEPAGQQVRSWLLEQVLPTFQRRCSCHAVLASRTPLVLPSILTQSGQSEATDGNAVEVMELAALDKTAVKEYLLSINMPEDLCEYTYDITHGHPLCFAIFRLLWLEGEMVTETDKQEWEHLKDEYNERILIEFIQTRLDDRLPSPYREWTHYGILVRRFNRELVQVLFPDIAYSEEQFQHFVSYPYVKPVAGAAGWYCIHEMLRETLFQVIYHQEKEDWQRYHRRAWRYYKGQPEQFYHAVALDEIKGLASWDRAMRAELGLLLPGAQFLHVLSTNREALFDVLEDRALQSFLSDGGKRLYKDSREDFRLQRVRREESEKPALLSLQEASKDKIKQEKKIRSQFKNRSRQRRISLISLITIISIIILLLSSTAYLSTRLLFPANQVTTLADSGPGSLRQIIATAGSTSTITFAPQLQGTIVLRQDLDFTRNVTVLGTGFITISNNRQNENAHIHIHKGAMVIWSRLTFADSLVMEHSFIYNEGNLTLNGCTVKNTISYDSGGGITNQGGTITMIDSTVSQNFASSNGGGIYSNGGTLTITGSTISSNTAFENGGGIYGLDGAINLSNDIHPTLVSDNQTLHNKSSRGGGIAALDSLLTVTGSTIKGNWTPGVGGGISVLGSLASISNSAISGNQAEDSASELAVEIDPESQKDGQAILADLTLPPYTGNPTSYIGRGQDNVQNIIRGSISHGSNRSQIKSTSVSDNNVVGTPAPVQRPPEESPDYHGTIDLAKYCQQIGYSRFDDTDPFHLMCIGSGETGIPVDPLQICRQQHPDEHITIDRLADYFDPTSWQCYANAGRLGPIATVQAVDSFCKFAGNLGIFNNQRSTAYDWKCLHNGGILGHYTISMPSFPVGLSVTDMCSYIYGAHIGQKSLVMDRLTDYHNPGGWECWQLPA